MAVQARRLAARRILCEVADDYGLTIPQLDGMSRVSGLVCARWVAIYRAWTELGMSHDEIAAAYNRDRKTIAHALNRIAAMPYLIAKARSFKTAA